MAVSVYVDTCVFLNLWKQEISEYGVPLWKRAQQFFDYVEAESVPMIFSPFVIRELRHLAPAEMFATRLRALNERGLLSEVRVNAVDYELARLLHQEAGYGISFFDSMHVALSMRTDAVLITRDRELLAFARGRCRAALPEDFKL